MLFLFISVQQWVVIGSYELGTIFGSGGSDEKDTDLARPQQSHRSIMEKYGQGDKI